MNAICASSGRLDADRRLEFAEGLALSGDLAAAIEVLGDAMALVPDWAAGWYRLGEWHEAAGQAGEAVAAWDRAIAADPADSPGSSACHCALLPPQPWTSTRGAPVPPASASETRPAPFRCCQITQAGPACPAACPAHSRSCRGRAPAGSAPPDR
ncbi:tetratricopeptide repeat protein [Mangrovicoccus ximenensis]|uniref:tetratricopeptide repeat protein n=1 Tax=Mangrovicoccus ximenensis TaxID=1911570 RepID=UPI0011AEB152|nr:tetratricopeptide repeat protein [Mangrovicoccus ximenensis]